MTGQNNPHGECVRGAPVLGKLVIVSQGYRVKVLDCGWFGLLREHLTISSVNFSGEAQCLLRVQWVGAGDTS